MEIYLISLLFLMIAGLKAFKAHKIWRFRAKGTETTAVITDKETVDAKWGIQKYWLYFQYKVADKIFEGKSEVSMKIYAEKNEGDDITIIYQKYKPQVNYLRSWYLESLSTQVTLVLSCAFAAILVPILF